MMWFGKREKILRSLLGTRWDIKQPYQPGCKFNGKISMVNEFLNFKGQLIKKQEIEGSFRRKVAPPQSPNTALLQYNWDGVWFNPDLMNKASIPKRLSFAEKSPFKFCKVLSSKLYDQVVNNEPESIDESYFSWYNSLPATPVVDLLYLLTWDVLMFEEMNGECIELFKEEHSFGEVKELTAMNERDMHLAFGDCDISQSSFLNNRFFIRPLGLSLVGSRCAKIFEFHSSGKLNVEMTKGSKKQDGESYYFGKVFINIKDGRILQGEMIELLTVTVTNSKGKNIPRQKRRIVTLESMGS